MDRLGAVPQDPVELDGWVRRLLAELLVLQLTGQVSVDLAASIRTTCSEVRRSVAPARATTTVAEDDDEDDDGIQGPDLDDEGDDAGGAELRVG